MKIRIVKGDITTLAVDVIVNAANSSLLGGGGVDGAIHRKAGPAMTEECRKIRDQIGKCKVSQCVITSGGNLKAKHIIHTVGPVWRNNKENESQLGSCYRNALLLADEHELESIVFPNISTGRFGFPKERAVYVAKNAVDTMRAELKHLQQIVFCCFEQDNYQLYEEVFAPEL